MMRRSHVFAIAGAALVAAPLGARGQGVTKIRIGASAIGDIIVALWGAQSGIFQKYGLDVEIERMNSSAAITAAVVGGALEMGKASLFGLVLAYAKGLPVVLEAASALYSSATPDAALLVAKDSPIQTARDLNGKIMASASLGDLFTTMNAAWMDQNGGDSRTLKYVELPGTAAAAAIAAGRVDAGMIAYPSLSEALNSGKCRVLAYPENVLGKTSLATAYFCTADYASKNGPSLARFRKALDEAYVYVMAHQADMVAIQAKFSDLDPKMVTLPSIGHGNDLIEPSLTQPTIDIMAKYKVIPKAFPVRELIDPNAFKK
jgi:NitT/TauT family transport system substrate-binding protein